MQRRLLWSLRAFQISLAVLLLAGLLSAAAWQYERADLIRIGNAAVLAAAVFAAAARCWQWQIQRAIYPDNFPVGPGHYGIDPLSDRRFITQ